MCNLSIIIDDFKDVLPDRIIGVIEMSYLKFPSLSNEQVKTYETLNIIEYGLQRAAQLEAEQAAVEAQAKAQVALDKELAKHLEETRLLREREAQKLLAESNQNLEVELRDRFFRANPFALASDFDRVKDKLKDDIFLERMKSEATSEQLIRDSGNYAPM